jgi:peptidoglycan/LPS O-acetylase OafA/YrhL
MCEPSHNGEQRRNNNFNFLRLVAAVTVVISHSFNVSSGRGFTALGVQLGDIAVDFFFVTSGFLVTASAISRRDPIFYLRSRVLRVFPGLIVATGFLVFVLGPLVTKLPVGDYFRNAQTYNFLFSNATLIDSSVQQLPGVFEDNPLGSNVNQPLWTLGWEITMYFALFLFTLPYLCSERYRVSGLEAMRFAFPLIFVAATTLLLFKLVRDNLHHTGPLMIVDVQARLTAMFFGGASLWLWRERISFAGRYGVLILPFLIAAALISPRLFVPLYYLTVVWFTLVLAHIDSPWLRKVNGMGDYSYGVYIYAYPVQQIIAMLWVGIGAYGMSGLAMLITFPLAFLSWHVVEKRAMALKYGLRARNPVPGYVSP